MISKISCLNLVLVASAALGCKMTPSSQVKDAADQIDGLPTGDAAITFGKGAHDFLPPADRDVMLAADDRLNGAAGDDQTVLALAGENASAHHACSSALSDVNCYADACALELGGNIEDNYIPAKMDPRDPNFGETIMTFWNGKLIKFEKLNNIWQYTFDGKPGGQDWPEKGAGLAAPVQSAAALRCDSMQQGNQADCIPGQKRYVVKKGEVTWTMLFRRNAPPIPGVGADSPYSIEKWGNIAVVGYRASASKMSLPGGAQSEINLACWFNTFNHTNRGDKKVFPIPVPGGRFGTTPEEEKRRQATIAFWDTPQEHRTLTANFGGIVSNNPGDNCVTCHGLGPVLDAVWYREKAGDAPSDSDIPFASVAGLHNPRTFWQETGSTCASCHKIWSVGTATCSELADDYTSVATTPLVSRWRQGYLNLDPAAPGAATLPANDKLFAAQVFLMPDPMSRDDLTLAEYRKENASSIAKIKQCCNGQCDKPTFKVTAPTYFGAQDKSPSGFAQQIPSPDEGSSLNAKAGDCGGGTCSATVTWQDPENEYRAPDQFVIAAGATDPGETCPGELKNIQVTPSTLAAWRNSYTTTVPITCAGATIIRLCGVTPGVSARSRSVGVTTTVSCP